MNILEIASKYNGTHKKPVIAIAKEAGIKVLETNSLSDSESGSIAKAGDSFVIYVNAKHPSTRKRFTIAHELGHYEKHREIIEERSEMVTRKVQPTESNQEVQSEEISIGMMRAEDSLLTPEDRTMEVEANAFAADLLMPENEFRALWSKTDSIDEIANEFGVSVPAATVRANKLFNQIIF